MGDRENQQTFSTVISGVRKGEAAPSQREVMAVRRRHGGQAEEGPGRAGHLSCLASRPGWRGPSWG